MNRDSSIAQECDFFEGLGITGNVWRRVFQWCQALLIALCVIAFVADFFAKSLLCLHLIALGLLPALLLLAVGVVGWIRQDAAYKRLYQPLLLLVWLLLFGGILSRSWPMMLSFSASTSALERLADSVEAGHTPSLPTRVGAYRIHAIETQSLSGGVAVCLWTAPVKSHRIGFVRSPIGDIPKGNQYTRSQLTPRWHHFAAD